VRYLKMLAQPITLVFEFSAKKKVALMTTGSTKTALTCRYSVSWSMIRRPGPGRCLEDLN